MLLGTHTHTPSFSLRLSPTGEFVCCSPLRGKPAGALRFFSPATTPAGHASHTSRTTGLQEPYQGGGPSPGGRVSPGPGSLEGVGGDGHGGPARLDSVLGPVSLALPSQASAGCGAQMLRLVQEDSRHGDHSDTCWGAREGRGQGETGQLPLLEHGGRQREPRRGGFSGRSWQHVARRVLPMSQGPG